MSKVTAKEIMDIIEDVLVEVYRSEYDALEIRIDQLLKSKAKQSNSSWGPIPKFKDEWGNTDWRDTGEMGG